MPPLAVYGTAAYRPADEPTPWPFAAFAILTPDASGYRTFDPVRDTARVAGLVRHATAEAAGRAGWTSDRIATFVHGHTPDGTGPARGAPDLARFAFLPLPSIASFDGGSRVEAIRRVLVVAPPGHADAVAWARRALSGQELTDEASGRPAGLLSLLPRDDAQVGRYVGRGGAASWSTVTPVVLPGHDDGDPRKAERLLRRALAHAGVSKTLADAAELEWRRVGFRAGVDLATRYRLPACHQGRLRYHLRVRWRGGGRPVRLRGPLAVGAGRYGGYGLLAAEAE